MLLCLKNIMAIAEFIYYNKFMKLIVCVSDNNGIMFNHRRQSQDGILREYLHKIVGENKLYMSPYSAKMFKEHPDIVVSENMDKLPEDAYYFMEDAEVEWYTISEIILCRWNRDYPADRFLPDIKFEFELKDTVGFKGSSHEKITVERWERRNEKN